MPPVIRIAQHFTQVIEHAENSAFKSRVLWRQRTHGIHSWFAW